MAPKKSRKKPSRKARKKPIRRVAAARRTLAGARVVARLLDEGGPLADFAAATRQLPLPHVPPPAKGKHSAEQLAAVTVQTIRAGRLRADRWQAAAAAERRPWAVWAAMQLDAAADRAGLPALPQGAR